jgi:hypothetical protein
VHTIRLLHSFHETGRPTPRTSPAPVVQGKKRREKAAGEHSWRSQHIAISLILQSYF